MDFFFQEDEVVEDKPEGPTAAANKDVLPPDHENAKKWFYRDPQGDLQGMTYRLL